jgi:hypothetical protein
MLTRPCPYSRRQRHSRSRDDLQPQALLVAQRRAVFHAHAADDQDVRLTPKLRTTRLADGLRPTILFDIGHVVDPLKKAELDGECTRHLTKRCSGSALSRLWSHIDAGVTRDHPPKDSNESYLFSSENSINTIELTLSIRENDWRASRTRSIGRVDGCGFRDDRNAFAVEEKGSGGGCRVDHGPRVVIAPVIAASMAA